MKSLSVRQAARCETAKHKACRCRCGGKLHGVLRSIEPTAAFFAALKADDPHHVDSEEQRKEKRKLQREAVRKREWDEWQKFQREHEPALFLDGEDL
jgi:hypothetical protein